MKKITKNNVMKYYYSDEELKDSMRISAEQALKWLAETNRFLNKALSKKTKRLQAKLIAEGW